MNKKLGIILSITIIIVIFAGIALYFRSSTPKITTVDTANESKKLLIVEETPEETVKKVATAYWDSSKYKDYATEYDFLSPADKKLINKEDYVKKQSEDDIIVIKDFEIDGVSISGNKASVRISIDANTGQFPGTTTFILTDGKWYKELTLENKKFLGITE